MKKRILSMLLAIVMVATLLPTTVFAADIQVSNADQLQFAFETANNGTGTTTVELTDNVTISSTAPGNTLLFTLNNGKNMVLDLKGKTLTIKFTNDSANGNLYAIDGGTDSTLTIKNGNLSVSAASPDSPVYAISSTGTVNIDDCDITVSGQSGTYGVDMKSGTITNSTITATSTNGYGIGVKVYSNDTNPVLSVSDCTITAKGTSGSAGIHNASNEQLHFTVNGPVTITSDGNAFNKTPTITNAVKVTAGDAAGSYVKMVPVYTITATANPSAGGSVEGGGAYDYNTSVTLTATPNTGYKFVNWTEGVNVVSTSASYEFKATADRTLVANFVESHSHCICGKTESCGGDHNENIEWQDWDSSSSLPSTSGNYRLTKNVTLSKTHEITSGSPLNLCLNGKTVKSSSTTAIEVRNGAVLNICDCKGGGVISGYNGNNGLGNFGINNQGGDVTINGGTITGYDGIGNNVGSLTVRGGTINGTRYGISHYGSSFYLSGAPTISGGTSGIAVGENLELNRSITINGTLSCSDAISVVIVKSGSNVTGTFAKPDGSNVTTLESYAAKFESADSRYDVVAKDGNLELCAHNYTYTANGAVITESCGTCSHSKKATLGFSYGTGSYTYNESAITPVKVTYDYGWAGNEPSIVYTNNTNVGKANAALTIGDTTANLAFTITKADGSVTNPTAIENLKYTGQPLALINAGSATGGEMQYSLDNSTWSTTVPTATNAGEYTVYYKVVGDSNHNDVAGSSVTVTIAKRSVTLTSATDSKVYDETALTNSNVTVGGDGFVTGEGATYTVTGTQTVVGSSANSFTYTLNSNTNAGNYTITRVEGTLTVSQSGASMTATTGENKSAYNYGETMTIIVNGITPTGVAATNVFTLTAPTTNQVAIWNDDTQLTDPQTVTGNALTFTLPTLDVGTYTLTAKFTGNANMAATSADVSITVDKAPVDADNFSCSAPSDLVYSKTAKEATVTGDPAYGAITVKYYSDSNLTTEAEPINVGTYYVGITTTGGNNYQAVTTAIGVGSFEITPSPVTVTADAKTIKYGENVPELTYIHDLLAGDSFTGALATVATSTSNVGEYDITVGTLANRNYNISFVGAKLTIENTDQDAPAAPTAQSTGGYNVKLNAVIGCEYSKDGINWQASPEFTDLTPGTAYTFYQRLAAKDNYNASPASAVLNVTTRSTYTVTFDPNGGTITPDNATTDFYGKLSSLPTPTRKNFAFLGWFDANEDGEPITAETLFTEDTTIYAQWEALPLTGTVTVSGQVKVGETLTVTVTDSNNTGTLGYQWYRNAESAVAIEGANSTTYTVTEADIGQYIYCVVSSTAEPGDLRSNRLGPVASLEFGEGEIVVSGYRGTYDGAPHSITVTAPEDAQVFYSMDDDTYSLEQPTFVNAGSYTVYYQVVQYHYSTVEGSQTVTITAATPTVTWPVGSAYVNDASFTATSGSAKGIDGAALQGSFTMGTADLSKAGEAPVAITFTPKNTNYKTVTKQDCVVTVSKRTVESVAAQTAIETAAYGTAQADLGLPAKVEITASGSKKFAVPVIWSGYNPTQADPQTLTGTLDLTGISGEVVQPATALKASILVDLQEKTAESFSYNPKTATYTGAPIAHEIVGALDGVVSIAYRYVGTGSTQYPATSAAPTNVGTYEVTATFTMASDYVPVAPKTAVLTIEKKEVTEPSVSGSYSYTGAEQTVVLDGLASFMTVTGNKATNAGSYTAVVTLDGNHKWAEGSDGRIQWSIGAKEVTPAATLEYTSIAYNGSARKPVVTVKDGSTVIPSGEYTVGYSNNINVGTATVTITDNEGGNYTFATIEGLTFQIGKDGVSPTLAMENYAYGNAPSVPVVSGNTSGGAVTIYYSTNSAKVDTEWENISGTTLNVGTYYMKAHIAATDNYAEGVSPVITFKVTQGKYAAPAAPSVSVFTVTVQEADRSRALEYSLNGTDWTNVPALTDGGFELNGLAESTQYTVYLRAKASADGNYQASAAVSTTWTTPASYSVAYHANLGTGKVPASVTQISGKRISVASGSGLKRPGYTFAGWNTAADGSGTDYAPHTFINSGATLYAQWTANRYTVKFKANGGSGTMDDQIFTYDAAQALPDCAFVREGYHFVGWTSGNGNTAIYLEGQMVKNLSEKSTFTLHAVWAENVYSVDVTIASDVAAQTSAKLMRGDSQVGEIQTVSMIGSGGGYHGSAQFGGVPKGTYNIVVTQGDITMTALIVITDHDDSITITMPVSKVNSVLEVKGEDTFAVVVGGLESEATTKAEEHKTITITMTVEKQEEQQLPETASESAKETQEAIAEIKDMASDMTLQFMDIVLEKTVVEDGQEEDTEKLSETNQVIEIVFPFDMTGKANITIYRHHNGATEQFAETTTEADGTFYVDHANHLIHMFTRKFSTYAIGYTDIAPVQPGGDFRPTTYSILVNDAKHGDVSASAAAVSSGATVTIHVTPDEGYSLAALKVTDKNGKEIALTKVSDGKYTFKMPASKVTVEGIFAEITAAENPFVDVFDTDYYYDPVLWAVSVGITNGTSPTTFSPHIACTRAMIVTILWRLEGEPVVNYLMQFDDIPADTWYTSAVRWAAAEGIVEGYGNGKFNPMCEITREQFAAILWRYAKYKGYDVSVGENTNILSYEDAFSISEYAIPAMQWACGEGLMQGDGVNLTPKAYATRAQAATLFQRFCRNVAKK